MKPSFVNPKKLTFKDFQTLSALSLLGLALAVGLLTFNGWLAGQYGAGAELEGGRRIDGYNRTMPTRVDISLPPIRSDFQGFTTLVNLAERVNSLEYSPIALDMSAANWVDANMCAPLGAILYRASHQLNMVRFEHLTERVQKIFQKNGFLGFYGHAKKADEWGTAIQYQSFETKDDRFFGAYIERHFKNKAIPEMSEALRKKFWESIFELFSNAVIHSKTELGIFTCGQYFPNKKHIDFAIADLGIGISQTLIDKKGLNLPPEEAIDWAMEGRNTTKTGSIPGGLGLKLLREFIRLNRGRIQAVSFTGYWEQCADGAIVKKTLPYPFPGTVVNIEINTADTNSYILSTEHKPEDLF